jgi:hypothetical protein
MLSFLGVDMLAKNRITRCIFEACEGKLRSTSHAALSTRIFNDLLLNPDFKLEPYILMRFFTFFSVSIVNSFKVTLYLKYIMLSKNHIEDAAVFVVSINHMITLDDVVRCSMVKYLCANEQSALLAIDLLGLPVQSSGACTIACRSLIEGGHLHLAREVIKQFSLEHMLLGLNLRCISLVTLIAMSDLEHAEKVGELSRLLRRSKYLFGFLIPY